MARSNIFPRHLDDVAPLGPKGNLNRVIKNLDAAQHAVAGIAYNPWIHSHCTPEQAVQMAKRKSRYSFDQIVN
jgi:hypothetical protein